MLILQSKINICNILNKSKFMKKILKLLLFFISYFYCNAQVNNVQIITKDNDTLKNVTLKMSTAFKHEFLNNLQQKIIYLDKDKNKVELLPSQVKSFKMFFDGEYMDFESIEDKGFAKLLYSNKIKLYQFIKYGYTSIHIFIIKRPNGKFSFMEAMGLSRLISKKVIKREITDCPKTLEKVENKELKIHGIEGVIELAVDYETNCF
jgi:hypothetical protein